MKFLFITILFSTCIFSFGQSNFEVSLMPPEDINELVWHMIKIPYDDINQEDKVVELQIELTNNYKDKIEVLKPKTYQVTYVAPKIETGLLNPNEKRILIIKIIKDKIKSKTIDKDLIIGVLMSIRDAENNNINHKFSISILKQQ